MGAMLFFVAMVSAPLGAAGVQLDVTAIPDTERVARISDDHGGVQLANRKPIPLADREGVHGDKCFEEMTPGRPTLAYLNKGVPYKSLWERTFLKELLHDVGDILICDLPGKSEMILQLLAQSREDPVGLIVAGFPQQMQLHDLEEILQQSAKKPRVLLHFSDEAGKHDPNWIYPRIMPHDGLVLRQYQFWDRLPAEPRTRIMPLGYNMHLDFDGDSCSAAMLNAANGTRQRKYGWAFVGGMHDTPWGNRADMVSELLGGRRFSHEDQLDSTEAFVGQKKGAEMFDVYKQAVFAPNLPGAKNNECFRVYESAIAGAIPVIVGDAHEIQRSYSYHGFKGDKPPFLFASTWKEARTKMRRLLRHRRRLEAMHKELPRWYCSWMRGIQNELDKALS